MNFNNKFKILQPKYYNRFQCNPNKCHESCCERWKIIIDKSTYEKYINSENKIIKDIVKTALSINEASLNSDDFAIINLNKEMACPFLNENNLCEIFINMGESGLSKTCKSYPRGITLVNDVIERGLEMSCSVAAELILLSDKGIEFEYVTDYVKYNDIYVVSGPIEDLKQIEIMSEIRASIIDILQTRTMDLCERVAIVGYFLNQVEDIIKNYHLSHEEVLFRIKEEKKGFNQEFIISIHEFEKSNQFKHLNNLLSMKFKEGDSISFFSKRYIESLMQVLDAFGNIREADLEENYRRNYERYLKPYLDKKGYILENFIVNYVFVYSSELFNLTNMRTSYLKICLLYGLVKFNLVGLATYNKGVNDDIVLKLIQSLSKTFIQDNKYWKSVTQYLENEKLDEYTKLITLILD